uniref:ATP synthase F0 subunit 8 n=1 Tax=Ophiactis savignyi TaxID=154024 RepID=UPI002113D237|nr:ATP synthase F0 subunit 8 [Ophiactis savignyi]USQ67425.1 ATP synthase F0 subunit 8 [Ophiactis savignyi]
MPQLEFTLWFANLITNWTILLLIIIIFNSSSALTPLSKENAFFSQNETFLTNNWPW